MFNLFLICSARLRLTSASTLFRFSFTGLTAGVDTTEALLPVG